MLPRRGQLPALSPHHKRRTYALLTLPFVFLTDERPESTMPFDLTFVAEKSLRRISRFRYQPAVYPPGARGPTEFFGEIPVVQPPLTHRLPGKTPKISIAAAPLPADTPPIFTALYKHLHFSQEMGILDLSECLRNRNRSVY